MNIAADTIEEYIEKLPEDRAEAISKLRKTVNENIPEGFMETLIYNMPGWVVPHSTYPDGYHCTPELPLPFLNIASQKNYIAVYHMGIYSNEELLNWFKEEYPKHCKRKLDMGKSCIRFKKVEEIPYELLAELFSKMTVQEWITIYEKAIKKK